MREFNEKFFSCMNLLPVYLDSFIQKKEIIRDNKNKSGVYRWTNKINGKSYIGSSIDLSKRFLLYYRISYLNSELTKGNSIIYKAILKYGYSNFKL